MDWWWWWWWWCQLVLLAMVVVLLLVVLLVVMLVMLVVVLLVSLPLSAAAPARCPAGLLIITNPTIFQSQTPAFVQSASHISVSSSFHHI